MFATPDEVAAAQERRPEIEMQVSRYRCTSCNDNNAHGAIRDLKHDAALEHLRSM